MVHFSRFLAPAVLLASLVAARPTPEDSAIGEEVAVSAPFGIPLSDTAELARQTGGATTTTSVEAQVTQPPQENKSNNMYDSKSSYDASKYNQKPQYEQPQYEQPKYEQPQYEQPKYEPPKYENKPSYQEPSYGSGKSEWGSNYDDCVQQCVAKYGAPPSEYKPTATSGHEGSSGNGATHTVIVAPSQGVLRFVPFVVNASVGDTILFHRNANNHTVTKSSALQLCNKTSDNLFASGQHNKDFEFTQVVNDTDPVYFYCATVGHCQKGMFGAINAPASFGSPTTVALAAQQLAQKFPELSAAWSQMSVDTQNDSKAANWGSNLDMKDMDEETQAQYLTNVAYTRSFLAANPETLKDDGRIDLSIAPTTPLKFPADIGGVLNAVAPPSTGAPTPAAPSPAPEGANPTTASALGSGAGMTSPRMAVAAIAVLATLLAL